MTGTPPDRMRGGIIAAGLGTRLRADGLELPKPLVRVAGQPMLSHVLNNFREASISRLSVIFNEESAQCADWLRDNGRDFEIDLTIRTTPSSFASFRIVAERLSGSAAVISTVDAWIPNRGFAAFARAVGDCPPDALILGVTDRVDDEKPLWVEFDPLSGRVSALGGSAGDAVTAGLYAIPAGLSFPAGIEFARLRDYLRWVVEDGRPVYGIPIPDVVDVDRSEDIAAAERLAASEMSET